MTKKLLGHRYAEVIPKPQPLPVEFRKVRTGEARRGEVYCCVFAQAVIRSVELIVQPGAKDGVGEMGVRATRIVRGQHLETEMPTGTVKWFNPTVWTGPAITPAALRPHPCSGMSANDPKRKSASLSNSQSRAATTGPTSPKKHSPKSFRFAVGITKKEAGGVYRLHGQCQGVGCR
jgi:hypothetical protein